MNGLFPRYDAPTHKSKLGSRIDVCSQLIMEILNQCNHPPLGVVAHLRRALRWFNTADLEGLYGVVLFDDMPEVTEDTPESIKRNLEAGLLCPGQYIPSKGEQPPYLMLFLKVIYYPVPSLYSLSPIPTIRLTTALGHGIAYHVLATTQSKYQDGKDFIENEEDEKFVDDYVSGILKRMQSRRYFRFGQWLIRNLADRYYLAGVQEWKAKHHGKAAEQWRKAWMLNPDHQDARQWYWRAKEMQDQQTPGAA